MERYKASNADFYAAYQVARVTLTPTAAAHRARRRLRPPHRANKINSRKSQAAFGNEDHFFYPQIKNLIL
jgi:hypothetical protein